MTRENIRYAKQILRQQQWRTALLVSDPLHMLRLKTIAQDNGIDSRSSPTRSTRYKSGGRKPASYCEKLLLQRISAFTLYACTK